MLDKDKVLEIAREFEEYGRDGEWSGIDLIAFAQRIYNLGLERAAEIASEFEQQGEVAFRFDTCAAAIREEIKCP